MDATEAVRRLQSLALRLRAWKGLPDDHQTTIEHELAAEIAMARRCGASESEIRLALRPLREAYRRVGQRRRPEWS